MEPAKMPNEQASKLLPPGSRNFRAASSTESDVDTKKTEQGAAPQNIANAQGAQQAPEQHDVSATGRGDYGAVSQGTQGSLGQISKEEIMIMRELLTRDNVDDSVKSSLLKQVAAKPCVRTITHEDSPAAHTSASGTRVPLAMRISVMTCGVLCCVA
jgi:hypothetical protein